MSETAQNQKRNQPFHCEMEMSRVDGVKAPPHDGTPRSHAQLVLARVEVFDELRQQSLVELFIGFLPISEEGRRYGVPHRVCESFRGGT